MDLKTENATFAGGCFWCTESIFLRLKGVISVIPGYSGGTVPHPTYEQVCTGTTGHAEAIQITFDPTILPYEKLVEIFFLTHDPTTLNQQGADIGPQYRSAIFFHSPQQEKAAVKVKQEIEASGKYHRPIVTEITQFTEFYEAEDYHHNYYAKNSYQPYCQVVIDPKLHKLVEEFGDVVKPGYK